MNIQTLLLYTMMDWAASLTTDILPARILAPQKILGENSDLYVRCSTFGFKKNTTVFVYLCRNGTGVDKQIQKLEENDTEFKIYKVTSEHSGNYSCVYSQKDHMPSKVSARGSNMIQIQVIASIFPADLSLSSSSFFVTKGEQVKFLCSLPNVLQTLGECNLIYTYLMREGTINQVQGFDVKLRQAKFVVEDVTQRDSGRYSCVVLPSQCFKEDEERLSGNNMVPLQVKASFPHELTLSIATVSTILLLSVLFWTIYRRGLCKSCAKHPQTDTDDSPQRQIGREPSEVQDDSFDNEDDSYQNVGRQPNIVDPIPVYDEVLWSEGSSEEDNVEPCYAKCSRSK